MAKGIRHKLHEPYPTHPIQCGRKAYYPTRARSDMEAGYAEKERLKAFYRVTEHELRRYVKDAIVSPEEDVHYLLRILELRLDAIIYRLGYTQSIAAAKDLIRAGAIEVNGDIMESPSYHVRLHDEITCVRIDLVPAAQERPPWLEHDGTIGRLRHIPSSNELHRKDIQVDHVIEYYAVL